MGYLISAFALLLLILTSWETIKKHPKLGAGIIICGLVTCGMSIHEYDTQQQESRQLLERIALESRRLHPQDFTFTMMATHGPPVTFPTGNPRIPTRDTSAQSFGLFASVVTGEATHSAEIRGTWTRLERNPEFRSHGPVETLEYAGRDLVFSGLENFPYMDSLSGAKIRIYVPVNLIAYGQLSWHYAINIVIRGKKVSGVLSDGNVVELTVP